MKVNKKMLFSSFSGNKEWLSFSKIRFPAVFPNPEKKGPTTDPGNPAFRSLVYSVTFILLPVKLATLYLPQSQLFFAFLLKSTGSG
jgi:hypothetical protein